VDNKDDTTTKEQNEFADRPCLEISNMGKRLSGKDSRARYAPKTIHIAMSLWLRDGKGYQEFQESIYCLLPLPRYLRNLKHAFAMNDGEDPKVYCQFKYERLRDIGLCGMIGHLMADKIKLKSDIAYNCCNKEIIGFVENILKSPETPSGDSKVPAMYANQWRFHSIHNKTHNAEFFFNSGSITKEELLPQYMHVVSCYEMSGVKVLGIVPDTGGPKLGLLKLLRKDKKVERSWPNKACLYAVNHMCLERSISTWHCTLQHARCESYAEFYLQECRFRNQTILAQGWGQLWVGPNF
jgi:hypothetical protein